jgi:hypothetical protein
VDQDEGIELLSLVNARLLCRRMRRARGYPRCNCADHSPATVRAKYRVACTCAAAQGQGVDINCPHVTRFVTKPRKHPTLNRWFVKLDYRSKLALDAGELAQVIARPAAYDNGTDDDDPTDTD